MMMRSVLRFHHRTLVVADEIMQNSIELAARAARVKAPVLLCGESGTGKELIARYIHEKGERAKGPFITVNCAAVPEGLLEAEFFGYEKGAFTGAIARRVGKFEMANGGTLLLDEISEMPLSLQAKLLRVLQEGEIDRLGGLGPIPVNCRIIATTNREPMKLVEEKVFREDLFYRINVIRIDCVPLRHRESAIEELAREFVRNSAAGQGVSEPALTDGAVAKLKRHCWPGNIRELQNAIERAVWLADGKDIDETHLDLTVKSAEVQGSNRSLSDVERQHILAVVQSTKGNRMEAADRLGITTRTLRTKLKEYGV
jgi:transcriptional regulator with PAS, ATPase and Fis domain